MIESWKDAWIQTDLENRNKKESQKHKKLLQIFTYYKQWRNYWPRRPRNAGRLWGHKIMALFFHWKSKALSTLATTVAEIGDSRRKRRLSPFSVTVVECGDSRRFRLPFSATVAAKYGDKLSPFSATIVAVFFDYSLRSRRL